MSGDVAAYPMLEKSKCESGNGSRSATPRTNDTAPARRGPRRRAGGGRAGGGRAGGGAARACRGAGVEADHRAARAGHAVRLARATRPVPAATSSTHPRPQAHARAAPAAVPPAGAERHPATRSARSRRPCGRRCARQSPAAATRRRSRARAAGGARGCRSMGPSSWVAGEVYQRRVDFRRRRAAAGRRPARAVRAPAARVPAHRLAKLRVQRVERRPQVRQERRGGRGRGPGPAAPGSAPRTPPPAGAAAGGNS